MSQGGQGRMEMTGRVLMDRQSVPCMCVFILICVFADLFVYFCAPTACAYKPLHVPPACVQHAYAYWFAFMKLCVCVSVFMCFFQCVCRLLSRHAPWLHAVPHQTVKPIPFCR